MNKKILFLAHPQVSHAHDTFYNGCTKLFGENNVYDFPSSEKFHTTHKNNHSYAWWCYTENKNSSSLPLDQWMNMVNNGEIQYLIGNNRSIDIFIQALSLLENRACNVIFIEEEGDPGFEVHRRCLEQLRPYYNKIDIHYKMDYIASRVGAYDKIYPFYMSGPVDKLMNEVKTLKPFDERKYDVCYMAGASHPNRKMYYDVLSTLKQGNNIILYGNHTRSLNEYFNVINDSKIFISVRGNEWSNTRNIEGPILGAALFTEQLEIAIPFDYIDGETAIFFNKTNLLPRLSEYLNDQEKLKNLAKESHEYAMQHHTRTARAQQMVDLITQIKK